MSGQAVPGRWRGGFAGTYGSALLAQFLVAMVGILLHVGLARAYGLDLYAGYVVSMSFTAAASSLLVGLLFEPYLVLRGQVTGDRAGASDEYQSLVSAATAAVLLAVTVIALGLLHTCLPGRGRPWEYALAAFGIGAYCSILLLSSRRAAIEDHYRPYLTAFALGTAGAVLVVAVPVFSDPVFAGWAVYAIAALPVLPQLRLNRAHLSRAALTRALRRHLPYARWSAASSALGFGAMQLSTGVIGTMIDPFLLARYRLALIVPSVLEHAFIAISNQLVRHTIEKRPLATFLGANRMRVAMFAAAAYLVVGLLAVLLSEPVLKSMFRTEVPLYKWSVLLVLLGGYAALLGGLANVALKARGDARSICLGYAGSSAAGIAVMYLGATLGFAWAMESSYVLSCATFTTILLLRMRHRA
jgi:hypothetical protein